MARLMVLGEARAAGLRVWTEGDDLVIEGPAAAEPLARTLLARKAEVVAALGDQDYQLWDAATARQQLRATLNAVAAMYDRIPQFARPNVHSSAWRRARNALDVAYRAKDTAALGQARAALVGLARATVVESGSPGAAAPPARRCDPYDIDDINDQSVAADEFTALRVKLAEGGLDGYPPFTLPNGSAAILDLAGYLRRRLLDLDDPRLADEAARRLRRLAAALTTSPLHPCPAGQRVRQAAVKGETL
jgi:hypothetical protein